MIKISPSSLHERHSCPWCVWASYNYGWSWPFQAGLYSRYSAAEEQTMPTKDCACILNDFDPSGPYSNGEWVEFPQGWGKPNGNTATKGNVMSMPLKGVESHGRGDVFVFGEFDFVSRYTHANRKPQNDRVCVMDAKTTFYPSDSKQAEYCKKNGVEEYPHNAVDLEYASKYLPQLASYAFAFENPADDEQVIRYRDQEGDVWPVGKAPRKYRLPHIGDPFRFEKVHDAGILMFKCRQEIIQTEQFEPEWGFTAQSKWVDLESVIAGRSWEEIITPLAQKLCDIIASETIPKRSEDCSDCRSGERFKFIDEHGSIKSDIAPRPGENIKLLRKDLQDEENGHK